MQPDKLSNRELDELCARLMGVSFVRPYSFSANAARELEAEIERRGEVRILLYNSALSDLVNSDEEGIHPAVGLFRLINATPRQRAEAFVEAMKNAA